MGKSDVAPLVRRLGAMPQESDAVTLTREEVGLLLDVADKARTLLANAYAMPADELGVRLKSEDAVRLQWALQQIGAGEGWSPEALQV
ncbi:MAG TPA: hypothetical protein VLK65_00400 [Vicinamibacteria bacterium]|nr:hypothetical protein [Vicinamibacteria bacterium]